MITLTQCQILSAILFTLGVIGVMIRKNPLVLFMCIEMMFNAVNLSLVSFSCFSFSLDGQVTAFLVIAVAAAEVAIGLAIIMAIFRRQGKVDLDDIQIMKG